MMHMRSLVGLATLAMVGVMATSVFAQPPGGGGRGRGFGGGMGGPQSTVSLAANAAVQKDLEATEDQAAKLKTLSDEARAEMSQGAQDFAALRDLPAEERRAKMDELNAKRAETAKKVAEKFKPKLAEVLNAKQVERLDQIVLQASGAQAYADPAVVKALTLSKEQQDKMAAINKDFGDKTRELMPARGAGGNAGGGGGGAGGGAEIFTKMRELGTARDKDLEAVLTADQKAQFAKMKGKEFDLAQLRGPGGPGGGRGGAGGGGARPQ